MPVTARAFWVIVHRWAGLSLALFLAVAGLTGMALAWEDDIEAWIAPRLLTADPARTGQTMRDPVALTLAAQARHPGMVVSFLPLTVKPGNSLRLRVTWRDPAHAPDWDELFIDPWSGRELGHRRWGDIAQGISNLMPFVYRLHYSLLLGAWGTWLMGVIAVVWTFDCFVGFFLTFPVRRRQGTARKRWLSRWKPAWAVRLRASRYRLTFDLHRAGGLWVWPVLLVFAVSSVSLNLPLVYAPALRALGGEDINAILARPAMPRSAGRPAMGLAQARDRGATLASEAMRQRPSGTVSGGQSWLWPVAGTGAYVYGFTTGDDIPDDGGASRVVFDSASGRLIAAQLATDAPAANRFTDWIVALHMGRVFGLVWKVVVSLTGLAVTMLCITGVLIWMKKRAAVHARR